MPGVYITVVLYYKKEFLRVYLVISGCTTSPFLVVFPLWVHSKMNRYCQDLRRKVGSMSNPKACVTTGTNVSGWCGNNYSFQTYSDWLTLSW